MTEHHYFYADWCGPCKQTSPVAEEKGVQKHDVEQDKEIANKYEVRSIPALVIVEDGTVTQRETGTKEVLNELEEL